MRKTAASMMAIGCSFMMASVAQAGGYGTAGCGLGSIVFGDEPGLIQVLAATTNGTFGNQTFGITTGTSNCDGGVIGEASTKAFVQANRETLSKDIARGQGETISSLSILAGCSDEAAVGESLQKNFDEIFPRADMSDTEVSESVVDALKADLALSCNALS